MMLKCYRATVDDECTVVVFAPNATIAKKKSLLDEYINMAADSAHIDTGRPKLWFVNVRRDKRGDKFAEGELSYLLQFYHDSNIHIFRALGIHEIDRHTCDSCGCSDFDKEEYKICWGCNNCKECLGVEFCSVCYLCAECGHNSKDSEDYADWQPECNGY
jgi:hypothetical protein